MAAVAVSGSVTAISLLGNKLVAIARRMKHCSRNKESNGKEKDVLVINETTMQAYKRLSKKGSRKVSKVQPERF